MTFDIIQEDSRFKLQKELDNQKTQISRNKLGQFSTPFALARDIAEEASKETITSKKISFLDPAIGTGVFYSAILDVFGEERINSATGYEVDPHYSRPTINLWKDYDLKINEDDFTRHAITTPEKFDLIIANPPYVRHHHLGLDAKQYLKESTLKYWGINPSGLSGLYCYFIYLSSILLENNGISCWLIPSEFLDVNYGKGVKELLTQKSLELIRVHRYDADSVQFDDALVSSCVLIFAKRDRPYSGDSRNVRFTFGGTLKKPEDEREIPFTKLSASAKWNKFFKYDPEVEHRALHPSTNLGAQDECVTLNNLMQVKRGIATGSNSFFVFSKDEFLKSGINRRFFTPILPSPRYLPENLIKIDPNDGLPQISKKQLLLDIDLPEEEILKLDAELHHYISSAPDSVKRGYLCSKRSPWYKQERRPIPPILCTYMSRSKDGKAFRFIRNYSDAIAANSYLLLYPKKGINLKPKELDSIWEYLSGLDEDSLLAEGRVYGGGLHKLEPKELGNIPIPVKMLDVTSKQISLF